MNGSKIALDTNQAIAVLNDTDDAGRWVQRFADVLLPAPVVGELRFGALNSRRASQNLQRVEQLVARCKVLDVSVTTAEAYARIRFQLKQRGRPIPENDVWIAAVCVEHDVTLATSDEHFLQVEELDVIKR
jgi:tRNA(fMet)-specific endonuclease VapC